ncbi:MAG: response regulator, partial [Spirochaetales bacterium]
MKILVVDDSQIMRNILKNILREKKVKDGEILEA